MSAYQSDKMAFSSSMSQVAKEQEKNKEKYRMIVLERDQQESAIQTLEQEIQSLRQESTVFQRELDLANESHGRLCREYQLLKRDGEVVKSQVKEAQMIQQEKEQQNSHLQ